MAFRSRHRPYERRLAHLVGARQRVSARRRVTDREAAAPRRQGRIVLGDQLQRSIAATRRRRDGKPRRRAFRHRPRTAGDNRQGLRFRIQHGKLRERRCRRYVERILNHRVLLHVAAVGTADRNHALTALDDIGSGAQRDRLVAAAAQRILRGHPYRSVDRPAVRTTDADARRTALRTQVNPTVLRARTCRGNIKDKRRLADRDTCFVNRLALYLRLYLQGSAAILKGRILRGRDEDRRLIAGLRECPAQPARRTGTVVRLDRPRRRTLYRETPALALGRKRREGMIRPGYHPAEGFLAQPDGMREFILAHGSVTDCEAAAPRCQGRIILSAHLQRSIPAA